MNTNNNNEQTHQLIEELLEFTHFIKTPLVSIKIAGQILNESMPPLIDTYKNINKDTYKQNVATSSKHEQLPNEHKLDKLASIVNNLITEANRISEHTKRIEQRLAEYKSLLKECNE